MNFIRIRSKPSCHGDKGTENTEREQTRLRLGNCSQIKNCWRNHESSTTIQRWHLFTAALPKGCFNHFWLSGASLCSLDMNYVHVTVQWNMEQWTDTAKPRIEMSKCVLPLRRNWQVTRQTVCLAKKIKSNSRPGRLLPQGHIHCQGTRQIQTLHSGSHLPQVFWARCSHRLQVFPAMSNSLQTLKKRIQPLGPAHEASPVQLAFLFPIASSTESHQDSARYRLAPLHQGKSTSKKEPGAPYGVSGPSVQGHLGWPSLLRQHCSPSCTENRKQRTETGSNVGIWTKIAASKSGRNEAWTTWTHAQTAAAKKGYP